MRDRSDADPVVIDVDAELSCWRQLEAASASELVFLFQEWEPAIRVGIHAYLAYPEDDFDSIEPAVLLAYERIRGRSRIPWSRAAPTARRIWQKLREDGLRRQGLRQPDAYAEVPRTTGVAGVPAGSARCGC